MLIRCMKDVYVVYVCEFIFFPFDRIGLVKWIPAIECFQWFNKYWGLVFVYTMFDM